jgi:hypothetical protein
VFALQRFAEELMMNAGFLADIVKMSVERAIARWGRGKGKIGILPV